jgi:thiol-activated cytolysin
MNPYARRERLWTVAFAILVAVSMPACSSSENDPTQQGTSSDGGTGGDDAAGSTRVDGDVSPDVGAATPREQEIDDYVRDLSRLSYEEPSISDGTASEPFEDGDYRCVTQPRSETKSYDSIVALAANSSTLWPGALVRGDSVATGQFTPIAIERAPLTLSVSLENLDGKRSKTMASPTLSAFREAIGEILEADLTGATAANIFSEIEIVHSRQQLALALGAESSWPGDFARIAGSFDFASEETRSRLVVRFVQAYYTVDIDPPSRPSAFFADSVTLDDLEQVMTDSSPPAYVSSITYGRMVVFTVESSYSDKEMKSALEFAYRGGTDVSGDVSLTYGEMLSSSKITAFIVGGSGEDAVQAIDSFEALSEYIKGGGSYSKDSPGAPIGYKLAPSG